LLLAGGAAAVRAQEPGSPPPLSKGCQIGDFTVATDHPLPNVAAALRDGKALRILAMGASAVRRGKGSYVHQIEKLLEQANKGLDVVVINRGVSGELAADAAVRIRTEVALTEPNQLLWQVGTNDALASVPLDEIETTVTDTVRWLKGHHVDVVLVGLQFVPPMAQDAHYKAVRDALRKIAAQANVIIIRRYEAMRFLSQAEQVANEGLPDELAQMEGGYECLSQYVARAIGARRVRQRPQEPRTDSRSEVSYTAQYRIAVFVLTEPERISCDGFRKTRIAKPRSLKRRRRARRLPGAFIRAKYGRFSSFVGLRRAE
jgi:lysophospholipase L1-like esterase